MRYLRPKREASRVETYMDASFEILDMCVEIRLSVEAMTMPTVSPA